MVLQGLTEGGVSGPITGLVQLLVGEECNTEKGPVPTPRKCLLFMHVVVFSSSFTILFAT